MHTSSQSPHRNPLRVLLVASVLLGACSGDAPAPVAPAVPAPQQSAMAPGAGTKSLSGTTDGLYVFTIDPRKDQKLYIGDNILTIPANAICDLATSSYGPAHWDDRCAAQRTPVTITAYVMNSATDHPSIDFQPAMRFNPKLSVNLNFYIYEGMQNPTTTWSVLYCNALRTECVDESLTDPVLAPVILPEYNMVFRRIKHFSGYIVQGRTEEEEQQVSEVY